MKICLFDDWNGKFTAPLKAHWEQLGHEVLFNPEWEKMASSDINIFYPADNPAVVASKEKKPHKGKNYVFVVDIEAWAGQANAVDYSYFDGAIFMARHIRQMVTTGNCPVRLIKPGIDIEKFALRPKPKFTEPIRRIAYVVGEKRIWDVKRFDIALWMLRDLLNSGQLIWQLHILGSYSTHAQYNDYCRHLIESLNLEDFIIWSPPVDNVSRWLDDKDYFFLSSTKEAFSYATAEAMAKGIKPVLGNWRGAEDIWGPYVNKTYLGMLERFMEPTYNPEEYRQYVTDRYDQKRYFQDIDDFIHLKGGESMDTTFTTSDTYTAVAQPPIQPPPPLPADVVAPTQPTQEEQKAAEPVIHKYRAVRGAGDNIFLVINNKKHWVLSADVYKKLGYKFGDEEKIENSELATYMPGETITPENISKYL